MKDFEIYSKCGRILEPKHVFHAIQHRRDLLCPLLNGVELLLRELASGNHLVYHVLRVSTLHLAFYLAHKLLKLPANRVLGLSAHRVIQAAAHRLALLFRLLRFLLL